MVGFPQHNENPNASGDANALYINAQEIQKLPLYQYDGPFELITRDRDIVRVLPILEAETVLGFDTETQPAFEKGKSYPTAIVQLATAQKVFLFQLARMRRYDWFSRIFSAKKILKVGVAIDQDIAKLRELHDFEPAAFVDLAHLAARAGIKNRGVRGLAALLMGIRVSKNARRSNWGRNDLSRHQILYAAGDAWLCRELYFRLSKLTS